MTATEITETPNAPTPEQKAQQTALDLARTLARLGLPPADYCVRADGLLAVRLDRSGVTIEDVLADYDLWLRAVGATSRKRADLDPRVLMRQGFSTRTTTTHRGVPVMVIAQAISITASAPEGGA